MLTQSCVMFVASDAFLGTGQGNTELVDNLITHQQSNPSTVY